MWHGLVLLILSDGALTERNESRTVAKLQGLTNKQVRLHVGYFRGGCFG